MDSRFVLFVFAIGIAIANAQYQNQPPYYPGGYAPPGQPQPYYNYNPYQFPPPPQGPSRADYGRAITVGQGQPQPIQGQPWPYSYNNQPVANYPQPAPEGLTNQIFKHDDPDQHRYLTPPSLKFKIGIVAEKLKDSNKDEDTGKFKSYLKEGHLFIQKNKTNPETPNITLEWDEEKGTHPLETGINFGGEGFNLATLNVFNGKLYSCDEATGIVYELKKVEEEDGDKDDNKPQEAPQDPGTQYQPPRRQPYNQPPPPQQQEEKSDEEKLRYVAQPWIILPNENKNDGFKCKWAVVRNNQLWIGSTGGLTPKNESEENSEFTKERQLVKVIEPTGEVTDVDFSKHYDEIADAYEVNLRQGRIDHEAVAWSDLLNKWIWAPRKVTKEKKDDETWDKKHTNEVALSDDKFTDVTLQKFGNLTETQGFIGLLFIPGTQDQFILALKAGADEDGNAISSLSVFDLNGKEVMPETKVADGTFAGVEFL